MLQLYSVERLYHKTTLKHRENGSKKHKKQRSQEEKIGRRKWIIRTLKRMEERQKRIDRRTRMLTAGLRELLILDEDYISMAACKDVADHAILTVLRDARHRGIRTGELAAELRIDDKRVSERIGRMNKRMEDEIGEPIITKYQGKWRLIKKLRRDFAASRHEEEETTLWCIQAVFSVPHFLHRYLCSLRLLPGNGISIRSCKVSVSQVWQKSFFLFGILGLKRLLLFPKRGTLIFSHLREH